MSILTECSYTRRESLPREQIPALSVSCGHLLTSKSQQAVVASDGGQNESAPSAGESSLHFEFEATSPVPPRCRNEGALSPNFNSTIPRTSGTRKQTVCFLKLPKLATSHKGSGLHSLLEHRRSSEVASLRTNTEHHEDHRTQRSASRVCNLQLLQRHPKFGLASIPPRRLRA